MIHRGRWMGLVAAGALASLLSGPGRAAQEGAAPAIPKLFGAFQPSLGVWAEYAVVEKASGKKIKMRMSVVGQEGQSFWYEVHQDDGENRNIVKMLVKGDPKDPENIQRLILKSGDSPASEMPKDFVAMGRKMATHMFEQRSGVPAGAEAAGFKVEDAGQQEVQVPAGTFKATFRRILDAQGNVVATSYFSPEVPPFGVVSSDTESSRMELLAHGRDAKSAITETPVPMASPPGMPKGMPRGAPPGLQPKTGK